MENQEKNIPEEPHVKIFNKEIGSNEKDVKKSNKDNHCNHTHKGSGIFGLVILFIGVLLLLNNFGVVSREIWYYLFPFWPVILILIGLRIIFGFSRIIGFVLFIVAFALFSLIVLHALILSGNPYLGNLYIYY